jgi:CRISPR-associated endonuclease/helicase Cas3
MTTTETSGEPWRLFWAKTNREKVEGLPEDWTHPLWAHLFDVGSAAQVLWDEYLSLAFKQQMADALGMDLLAAGRFLSIWIGLHDLGKGTPCFQEMHAPSKARLTTAGLAFHERPHRLHHGHASIAIVENWLEAKGIPADTLLDAAAACVGIHHGKLCRSEVWKDVAVHRAANSVLGSVAWRQAQHDLAEAVFVAWGAEWPDPARLPGVGLGQPWPEWLLAFAGWATLADWLGSMQTCYDLGVQAGDELRAYGVKSRAGAEKAFRTAELHQRAGLRALNLTEHFGADFKPRPLQEIARDLDLTGAGPHLLIVEAPTGEGKTEAAFYLTARLGGGAYVAMPSQATSDGLYPRLQAFLTGDAATGRVGAHRGEAAAVRLVHGNDLLREDALALLAVEQATAFVDDPAANGAAEAPDPLAKGRVLSWFMPKKRALLVPYGVGTVDQLFLGVLFARHFFLRLFALSGKTVVFDEVHAYDTYMNTLFGRLLHWLRALDVHVVVLSATLPGSTRARLLEAWGVALDASVDDAAIPAPYPVAWHATAGLVAQHPFPPAPNRGQRLVFRWCTDEVETIAAVARTLLAQGATVIVICNKVERAQQVFALLDDASLLPDPADRLLLHARMPQSWRKAREAAALKRFGKNRPSHPALLVGTQVIEQSLDLDADALMTDLAPVDLLLQRAGRLHRHERANRPAGFTEPMQYIACAGAAADELPDVTEVSGSGHIYGRALLWKTRAVLQAAGGWALPLGDGKRPGYRTLVEAVYGDLDTPPAHLNATALAAYEAEQAKWAKANQQQRGSATQRLVPEPRRLKELFDFEEKELIEEDDAPGGAIPQHLLAATRNPDSISAEVLLLYRTANGWATTPGAPDVLTRRSRAFLKPDTVRELFGAAIRLSQPGIVSALWSTENAEWEATQQQYRLLQRFHLVELTDHTAQVGAYTLRLDERLGLIFSKTTIQ